jgi:predicted nucleotide-binding protein
MVRKRTRLKNAARPTTKPVSAKRPYLKQSDVPLTSLDEALRIPTAIVEHYAGKSTPPLHVAKALNIDPGGTQLKVLSGGAIAFGLIEGGAQASAISITELARRILRPTEEDGDLQARREAVLRPRIFSEFLRQYDGHSFPREDLALNVLEEKGVPRNKTAEVLSRIHASAELVGFITEIKGKKYVTLQGSGSGTPQAENEVGRTEQEPQEGSLSKVKYLQTTSREEPRRTTTTLAAAIVDDERRRKVFITHGKNRDLVEPIKKLLEFGEMTPVVSVERQSVSKPVPEKVMGDMRSCGAAIIHVDADQSIRDASGSEHVLLNPNVLIEVGAAMAFYGRRFILLVREGVKLPSNLQGLYEVRYAGETLDANSTIKLLEAIKDIKNYALPTDPLPAEA